MGDILILAEHDGKQLSPATAHAVSAASELKQKAHVLVVGSGVDAVAKQAGSLNGVTKVLLADAPHLAAQGAEDVTGVIMGIAANYGYVLATATSFGKNILPRVAALLDVAMISDAIAVIDGTTFKRPIYAGNAIATVQTKDKVVVMSVRKTAFEAAKPAAAPAPVEAVTAPAATGLSRFIKLEATKSERPELTNAGRVVSGGRAMGSRENFALIEALADKLGAAIGASRAAVDAGYAPNDWQVGQTGKVVAPELYVAVGISGAIQHLAGMKDSKVIVAINKDENAPIFEVADYGLVADLFDAVPKLTQSI
ncbi:electron transfer flavoprotein subunit alpha/FixB family protein [bacterium]|nr:electron transfer flavoprotein subunit alpha/FixB family protein [bacterium]